MKNNYIKYAATLAIICLAASGLLSVVFNLTQPKILLQKAQEENAALKDVFPQAQNFKSIKEGEETIYYEALNKKDEVLGYCFKAVKKGYSSDIVTMVGMDKAGVINRIKILSQNETPGLGTKIAEVIQKETLWDIVVKKIKPSSVTRPWFQEKFDNKNFKDLKDSVEVISGATISSSAVIDSIQDKAKDIMERVRHGR